MSTASSQVDGGALTARRRRDATTPTADVVCESASDTPTGSGFAQGHQIGPATVPVRKDDAPLCDASPDNGCFIQLGEGRQQAPREATFERAAAGSSGAEPPRSEPEGGKHTPHKERPKVETSSTANRPTPPATFCCPISMEVMNDPVMVATGHTYDRVCIVKWLSSGRGTCPLSGQRLRHSELTPNIALRNVIQVRLSVALLPRFHRPEIQPDRQQFKYGGGQ